MPVSNYLSVEMLISLCIPLLLGIWSFPSEEEAEDLSNFSGKTKLRMLLNTFSSDSKYFFEWKLHPIALRSL